ncbi:hypothetical protein V9K67_25190 [Paraflavisolibacter sp. H34]|uniref:hypothetical protein n=1 Tax=Huijunlia imazamoxiresistens TaxID=3127457 RepID=UPI003015A781
MKKIFNTLLVSSLLLSFLSVKAQTTDSTARPAKPQFKVSINYNSGLNYYGRTDNLKSSGLFPMAELWISPKWYVNAAPVFVNNAETSMEYAGTVSTLGFLHTTDKWLTNLYVLKPFYKESSDLVQSALKAQSGANLAFLNKVLNLNLGGDVKFSNKVDFGASAGVDHIIRIQTSPKSVLVLDPSVYAYAGTQQFSRTYLQKSNHLLFPRNQQVTETVQQFNLLSLEASVPVIFSTGKVQVLLTPAYVVPKNLVSVEGRPDLSEKGEKMFYATAGVKYTF